MRFFQPDTIKYPSWPGLFVLLILPVMLIAAQPPWATGQSRGEDLQIKLVTFGVGDDIPSFWGHTALVVEDVRLKHGKIYNYGLFSFGDGMVVNFLMGRLIFSGGAFSVPSYLNYYRNLNREIRIATLNLPPSKKVQLASKLAESVLPENRDYLYHHYNDNCATRLRDYLDEAVDGQLYEATQTKGRMDFREHTKRYTARNPFLETGLVYLMNNEIDRPVKQWDEMFLPDELERAVLNLKYSDSTGVQVNLVSDHFVLFDPGREPVPESVLLHWPWALLIGMAIGGLGFGLARWSVGNPVGFVGTLFGAWQALIGLLIGVPGLILFLMSSFTEHTVTYFNENLFYAHPIFLYLVVSGIAVSTGKLRKLKCMYWFWSAQLALSFIALVLKLTPMFYQDNGLVLAFLLPIHFGSWVSVAYLYKKLSVTAYLNAD